MPTRLPSTLTQYADGTELGGLPPHQDVLPASLASQQAVSHQKKEAPPRTALASHLPSSFHTSLLGLLVCYLLSGLGAGCQLTWSCASLSLSPVSHLTLIALREEDFGPHFIDDKTEASESPSLHS